MRFLKDKIYFFLITVFAISGIFGLSQFVFSEDVEVIMTIPSSTTCGDGVIEGSEVCDRSELDGQDCTDHLFGCGTLACAEDCLSFVTTGCSNSCCFLPGTKVLLADGSDKNIEEVEVGDFVLGYNEGLGINQPSKVLQTFVHQNQDYLLINDFLKVTDKHPIFINEKWVEAGSAKVGDRLKDYLGGDIFVRNIVSLSKDSLVYNLEVENTHTYYAEGILVHNKGDETSPEISEITSTTTKYTAQVTWTATDDISLSRCSFVYGPSYSLSTSTTNVSSAFTADILDLTAGTSYDFKITCTDSSNNFKEETGTFTTEEGPTPKDETAPNILSYSVIPGVTTSSISWVTDEEANEQINYGTVVSYGPNGPKAINLINYTKEHSVFLIDLIPSTTYYFQILGSDVSGNTTSTDDYEFITDADTILPPNVEKLSVDVNDTSLVVTWTNPLSANYPDFVGVKVIRKIDSSSAGIGDGEEVYDGDGQTYTDVVPTNISFAIEYYYTVFSYDTSGNYSTGASNHNNVPLEETENCTNLIDDDNDGDIDCLDLDCFGKIGCTQCSDEYDNDGDGKIDYGEDLVCSSLLDDNESGFCDDGVVETYNGEECDDGDSNGEVCEAVCSTECLFNDNTGCVTQCNDDLDNDGDGKVDYGEDMACSSLIDDDESGYCGDGDVETYLGEKCDEGSQNGAVCKASCSTDCALNDNSDCGPGGDPQCSDGTDNDGDGLTDYGTGELNDPGCESLSDNNEYNPPVGDVPVVDFNDLVFKAGNREVNLIPKDDTVTSLSGSYFSILILAELVKGEPDFLTLRLNDVVNNFKLEDGWYFVDISFPEVGIHEAYIEGSYKISGGSEISLESVLVNLNSLPYGKILTKDDVPVAGVKVTLFKDGEKFETGIYGQPNPINTNVFGKYAWVIPNGNYHLEVEREGYYGRKTQLFSVKDNVINNNLSLIIKPEKIIDVIDPEAPIQENIINVAKNITEKTKVVAERTVQVFKETVDNPVVEETAKKVVAPAAIGTVVVTTLPSIWFNLLNLLRFLFLQPLMLLGRRKRKKWGQVYNSLNKLPVDLVTVRLLDVATSRVVQSRVTDKNGRFIFSVKQGRYKIVAHKHGLIFPSALLSENKEDGIRTDIYHGEEIVVDEEGTFITPNIPLDPEDQKAKPLLKIRLGRLGRSLQVIFSWLGLAVTVVALYISPAWYMWVLLISHLFIFFVFRRLAMPRKPKGWGVVYGESGKKPLGKTIARLFDSKFNKLISTQVTDKKGRYTFLAGDNKYYVTFEHDKYDLKNTGEINLQGKEEGVVAVDINLEKKK